MIAGAMRTLRIASVFGRAFDLAAPSSMSEIRWLRMAAALGRRGFDVDLITPPGTLGRPAPHRGIELPAVPISKVDWSAYDVVKVAYPKGFEALVEAGGAEHPFVICRLGGVIDRHDRPDIPFDGGERRRIFEAQTAIARGAHCVAVSTRPELRLWQRLFGHRQDLLVVPAGVDAELPVPGPDPLGAFGERIVLHAGNLRGAARLYASGDGSHRAFVSQRNLNRAWQRRLNRIGERLHLKDVRLCCVGPGARDRLDPRWITDLGVVPHSDMNDLHHHAHASVALAQGAAQLHECSKLYGSLRAGLPAVSEAPIPNNHLLDETRLGCAAPFGDDDRITERLLTLVDSPRAQRRKAMQWMATRHSWDCRAALYDAFIRSRIAA